MLKVADELGYHPQAYAQGLARNKKNIIMVLVPVLSNYFFMEVLAGIQDEMTRLPKKLRKDLKLWDWEAVCYDFWVK